MSRIALSLVALLALSSFLAAEDPKKDGGGDKPPAMEQPAPPPEMDQCANWVGEFTCEMTGMGGPGAAPDKGTRVTRKALKGMAFIGDCALKGAMGEMEGHIVYTYSEAEKKWHVYWIDSALAGHMSDWVGEFKDGTLTVEATEDMGGEEMHCRITEHWVSKDKVDWKMDVEKEGKWGTMMSATYTRTK